MRAGDLVVDTDMIYHALTGMPMYEKPVGLVKLVFSVRDFIVSKIRMVTKDMGDAPWYNTWVIIGGAKRKQRSGMAYRLEPCRVIVLEVDANECIRRIAKDPRRTDTWEQWQDIIRRWWDQYEPDENDIVIRDGEREGAVGSLEPSEP